jgi:hypothetical protein
MSEKSQDEDTYEILGEFGTRGARGIDAGQVLEERAMSLRRPLKYHKG